MPARVYIETTVVSYLTARPSRDVVAAARQQLTAEWWWLHRPRYQCCISSLVEDEAKQGDKQAAALRLETLRDIEHIPLTDPVYSLALSLLQPGALPVKARDDAIHLALCAVHRVPYLLTWNFRHLANVHIKEKIQLICAGLNYEMPQICTPEELL